MCQPLDRHRHGRGEHGDDDAPDDHLEQRVRPFPQFYPARLAAQSANQPSVVPGSRTTAATSTAKTTATALATGATNSDGVAVIPASGTQLSYDQFSSLVASPLESAYYATVSSAGACPRPSWYRFPGG